MTWNTVLVAADRLAGMLTKIRSAGGVITNCRPQPDGVCVTWMAPSGQGAAAI